MKKRKIVFVLTVLLLLMGLVFSGCDNLVLDEEPPDAPGTEASKEPTLTSGTETPEESAVTPGEENGENPDSPGTETPEEPALSPGQIVGPFVVAELAVALAALPENTATENVYVVKMDSSVIIDTNDRSAAGVCKYQRGGEGGREVCEPRFVRVYRRE